MRPVRLQPLSRSSHLRGRSLYLCVAGPVVDRREARFSSLQTLLSGGELTCSLLFLCLKLGSLRLDATILHRVEPQPAGFDLRLRLVDRRLELRLLRRTAASLQQIELP